MLFNSYIFIFIFLPLALAGYYLLNKINKPKFATIFLTLMSFWFYGYSNWYYLIIPVAGIILNYFIVSGMERYEKHKKILMWLGVILNIGVLFVFKYYDFFLDNLNSFIKTDKMPFLRLALPIGISFYTFQQISYLVDYYRGKCEKYGFIEYASYVSFFPTILSGPIAYHSEIIPQFRDADKRKFNSENFSKGLYAFACGMAKKVLVADIFGRVVDAGYSDIFGLNSISAIVTVLSYALQIYFDFSGYCDMAYGIVYMFNIELPINFNSPFKSSNVGEFWNRWHMTLNRFFRDYVYIPMGGSRKGICRTYINTMVVFLISGLWHGADWSFVVWGGLYGIAVCINRAGRKQFAKMPKAVGVAINFLLFVFIFIFFRADDISSACSMFGKIFGGGLGTISPMLTDAFNSIVEIKFLYRLGFGGLITALPGVFMLIYLIIALIMCFVARNTQEKVATMKFNVKEIVLITIFLVGSIISLSQITTFVYFNF